MITKTTLVYIGPEDPPEYTPENFVDEDELMALLEDRIRGIGPSLYWIEYDHD
jgi:hypothetical protein